MIEQLKDLKDTYEVVRAAIDKGKEPTEDLMKIASFLNAVAADPTFLSERADKDYKRYFYDDFTNGILKRLNKEKSRDEKVCRVYFPYPNLFGRFLNIKYSTLKRWAR